MHYYHLSPRPPPPPPSLPPPPPSLPPTPDPRAEMKRTDICVFSVDKTFLCRHCLVFCGAVKRGWGWGGGLGGGELGGTLTFLPKRQLEVEALHLNSVVTMMLVMTQCQIWRSRCTYPDVSDGTVRPAVYPGLTLTSVTEL